jgi:hypothetical protein
MPDDPQNPGNPNDPVQQFGTPTEKFQQSGVGTPSSVDPAISKQWSDIADFAQSTLQYAQQLTDKLNASKTPLDAMAKDFQKFRDQLRFAVDATDDVSDSLKEVLALNKKFATQGIAGLNKKSYAEVKKYLQTLQTEQEKLLKKGFFNKTEQKVLEQAIGHTAKAMGVLDTKIKNVGDDLQEIDEDTLLAVASAAKHATREAGKLGTALEDVGRTRKGIADLNKIMGTGLIQKMARTSGMAKELRTWQEQARKEGGTQLKKLREDFVQKYGLDKGEGRGIKDITAFRKTNLGRGAGAVSGRTGLGGYFDRFAENLAERKGVVGRVAESTLELGGGNVSQGIGVQGLAGVAKVGEMAGELGIALEVTKKLVQASAAAYDKVSDVEANRDIFKKYGGAGIFTQGGTANQAFTAAKYNLQGRGMAMGGQGKSLYGMTIAQNTEILDAFTAAGMNLEELSTKLDANAATGVITDRKARTLGGVQELAYTTGKQLGLATGQTTAENIKLLYQYGQSQESVNKLFKNFLQDTKAAGITTTQYLKIIDDISGSFDNMSKSLSYTTTIMRTLGATGVATSEDLKDALALYTKGPEKGLEQLMAAIQMMGKEEIAKMAGAVGTRFETGRVATAADLKKNGLPNEDLTTIEGLSAAMTDVANSTIPEKEQKNLTQQLQALSATLRDKNNLQGYVDGTRKLADVAESIKDVGTLETKAMMTRRMADLQMKKAGQTPGGIRSQGPSALFGLMSPVFGLPQDYAKLEPKRAQLFADTIVQGFKEKPGAFNPGEVQAFYKAAVAGGLITPKEGAGTDDMRNALNVLAKGPNGGKFGSMVAASSDLRESFEDGVSGLQESLGEVHDDFQKSIPKAIDINTKLWSATEQLDDSIKRLTSQTADLTSAFQHSILSGGGDKTPEQLAVEAGTATPAQKAAFDNQTERMNFWGDLFSGKFKMAGREFMDLNFAGGAAAGPAASKVTGPGTTEATSPGGSKPGTTIVTTNNNVAVTQEGHPTQQAPSDAGESKKVTR